MVVSNSFSLSAVNRILELARWAPSGDNTQPWRFEVLDDKNFIIHPHDTRDWCVYDLGGCASQIAVGALLETIAIAASCEQMTAQFSYQDNALSSTSRIRVELNTITDLSSDPLATVIKTRCTQRRPMSTKPLTTDQKVALEQAVGPGYRVLWFDGWQSKWYLAKLLFKNAQIRLTIPEAYQVHKRIIKWDAQFSEDMIPDQAVGLDPLSLKSMRWAMKSWSRVQWLNRYLAGTWLPRIQLDLLPALCCASHFIIVADNDVQTESDYHLGGRAMQRFWLSATQLGLQFQPEMTPLIFSKYVTNSVNFTCNETANNMAQELTITLGELIGNYSINSQVFMGRVGTGSQPTARSIRMPLSKLLLK